MRNLIVLASFCTFVIACGSVTVSPGDGGASGKGGASGAGTAGAAGTSGAAGTAGSAGAAGAGGASAGSTGHAGTSGGAGAGGAGGTTGTAGSGGTAGGAAGSTAGAGGTIGKDAGVDAAESCDSLQTEYAAAFKEARTCNPFSRVLQCQMTAPTSLPCPSCTVHVDTTTRLDDIRARWTKAACKSGLCPAYACVLPGNGVCAANDGGVGGTCVDDHSVATTQ